MKRFSLICLFCIILSPFAILQADDEQPFWVSKPVHIDGKTTYVMTVNAFGYSKEDARNEAEKQIAAERGRNAGKYVGVNTNNNLSYSYRIIDEYWKYSDDNKYVTGNFLVQICKTNNCTEWEEVEVTNKYPFSARCFVPGMAQIYKGSKVKGGLIIAGEAVGIGGIVTCFSLKSSYEKLMQEDPKHMAEYSQNADLWQNIGWGCIAFTAALYVYNIIDGAVARGDKHITVKPSKYVALAPMVSPRGDVGLAMQIKF